MSLSQWQIDALEAAAPTTSLLVGRQYGCKFRADCKWVVMTFIPPLFLSNPENPSFNHSPGMFVKVVAMNDIVTSDQLIENLRKDVKERDEALVKVNAKLRAVEAQNREMKESLKSASKYIQEHC